MKEHPNYENGQDCEFMCDGKLRGGKILTSSLDGECLVGYHAPSYREIVINIDKLHKIER